jgi:hypothetical protein
MSTLTGLEPRTRPGPRAAIYARISLDKVGEAAGVGRQTEGCSNLAANEGWIVEHVLIDNDLSAYSLSRVVTGPSCSWTVLASPAIGSHFGTPSPVTSRAPAVTSSCGSEGVHARRTMPCESC